jgi:hypothetical protein
MRHISEHSAMSSERSSTLISQEKARKYAALVVSCYRNTEVVDPDIFLQTAAAVMTCYSEEIVREAFDPRTGMQTRQKWLPTVSEIREACEKVAGEHANRQRREMLNRHRVLLDTPEGLRPEAEAKRMLPGPGTPIARTAEERAAIADAAVARFRAGLPERDPKPGEPPRGLTDEQRQAWYQERLEVLAEEIRANPLGFSAMLEQQVRAKREGRLR